MFNKTLKSQRLVSWNISDMKIVHYKDDVDKDDKKRGNDMEILPMLKLVSKSNKLYKWDINTNIKI